MQSPVGYGLLLFAVIVAPLLSRAEVQPTFATNILPLLSRYCFDCHNDAKHKGDVVLDKFKTEADLLGYRATWQKVVKNIEDRAMPPENKPQPSDSERTLLLEWLNSRLFAVDCNKPDPGRVTIRRLNRFEYNNTIRDLVGVDFNPAENFPVDDVGYGFDNIGDVLSLPPMLLEKYLAAAERIMETAIAAPRQEPLPVRYPAATLAVSGKATEYTSTVRGLSDSSELHLTHVCSVPGEYAVMVRAFQMQAGEGAAHMAVRVGTNEVKVFEVSARELQPQVYRAPVKLEPGTNRFSVRLANPTAVTNTAKPAEQKLRRLMVEQIEIVEPAGTPVIVPESHRRIFACHRDGKHVDACSRGIVSDFARRAFRHPVDDEEIDRLMRVYSMAEKEGEPFERRIQLALSAVLVSPHFLFRGEIVPEPNNPKAVHPVNEHALAARLSYFLWSSMPDAELSKLAVRGELRKRGVLESQVQRMVKDSKASAFVESFTGQWLQIRNLAKSTPDTNVFKQFDDKLRGDMEKETQQFFAAVLRENRPILDFVDGNYTYVNERLARHYGIADIRGEQFQKVSFNDKRRAGVLTHASILTITANPARTSPVKRGKWVLDNMLGTPPPPPPPGVPELKEDREITGTLRERLEKHRADPACASCHDRMDPIGYGLENFDAVGAWRDTDEGVAIDPTGTLPGGVTFKGPADLRKILREQKAQFTRCLTEKVLTYALGRGLEYYDKCAVDRITSAVAKDGYRFQTLILEVVKSTPFQMRRGDDLNEELGMRSED